MSLLNSDIYYAIFTYIYSLKDIIHLSQSSKELQFLCKSYEWTHICVFLEKHNYEFLIHNFNFKNIELGCYVKLSKKEAIILGNCDSLNLSVCKTINIIFKFLTNCKSLNLSYCYHLTDKNVKF